MKFLPFTIAALSGLAVEARQQSADVVILQSSSLPTSSQPTLPREVARHILLQRTSRSRYGSDLRDIPNSIDTETTVEYIATFGKSPAPLFTQAESSPAQLVVILEGLSESTVSEVKDVLSRAGHKAAFAVADPPSATANNRLMTLFRNMGISSRSQCSLDAAINPFNRECWTGPSSVVKYDTAKSPETLRQLVDSLPQLERFVTSRDVEVTILLMPESSRTSKLDHWSSAAAGSSAKTQAQLYRRSSDAETVITDGTVTAPTRSPLGGASIPSRQSTKKPKAIPQCFASFDRCMSQTGNCTGHGECKNRYLDGDSTACFSCLCGATKDTKSKGDRTIHWGGNMCQKQDISVPFWLITGFTITIVGAIIFSIGLLYSVGEEQLPGVIGAGVSRTK